MSNINKVGKTLVDEDRGDTTLLRIKRENNIVFRGVLVDISPNYPVFPFHLYKAIGRCIYLLAKDDTVHLFETVHNRVSLLVCVISV